MVRVNNEHITAFIRQWRATAEQRDLRAKIASRTAIALKDDSLEVVVGGRHETEHAITAHVGVGTAEDESPRSQHRREPRADCEETGSGFHNDGRMAPNGSRLSCGASAGGRKRPALRYELVGAKTDASFESRPRQLQALVRQPHVRASHDDLYPAKGEWRRQRRR